MKRYSRLNIVIGCCLIGLLMRLGWLWCDATISRDGASYLLGVQRWFDGATFEEAFVRGGELMPVLYVYLIRFGMGLGWDPEATAIGISLFSGIAAIALVYVIGLKMFRDERIAAIAALVLALHPEAIELSTDALRDSLYLMLCLASWTGMLYALAPSFSRISAIMSGIMLGLAIHCRYEALEVLVLIFGVLVWSLAREKERRLQAVLQIVFWIVPLVVIMWLMMLPSGLSWNLFLFYLRRMAV